jgi:hypothetical protein
MIKLTKISGQLVQKIAVEYRLPLAIRPYN